MIEQIKEALEKATPGPWVYEETSWEHDEISDANGKTVVLIAHYLQENADLIANTPTYLRYLLDELEKETKVNENLIDRLDQSDRLVLSYATSKGMNEELFKMMQEFDRRYRHSEFDFTKIQSEHTAMKETLEMVLHMINDKEIETYARNHMKELAK